MTTAREKLENLTNAWYGYDLFVAGIGLFSMGLGIFSIVWTALGLAFSLGVTYFIGRRLINRSSFWRSLMIVVSAIGGVLAAVALVRGVLDFELSFGFLTKGALTLGSLSMYVKSLGVLLDKQVKAYFA